MYKTFSLAGCIGILLACNNGSVHNAAHSDSAHGAHQSKRSSGPKEQDRVNPVSQAMDNMMQQMHHAKPTGNNDIDFAVMMVAHHKGAVDMSKLEVDQGSNAEMKEFAQKVIDDQNKEISFMEAFILKAPKTASPNAADFQKALNGSMMVMMHDTTTTYNDIDKDFAALMIPHHQSAVDMAEAYLQYGQENSLKTLCRNIINSQTKEINWLKEWLAKNTR